MELEQRVFFLEAENRRIEAWRKQVGRRARERREVQMTLFTEELECLQRSEQQYQVRYDDIRPRTRKDRVERSWNND